MISRLAAAAALASALMSALAAAPALAKGDPKPLFADDAPITLTITGPINELVRRAERSTDPFEANLSVSGAQPETLAIELSARGNSRRRPEVCRFPPLRIAFSQKPGDASLFDGQKRLKLVTHCNKSERFQQHYLLEYAAYRLYNIVTPVSLKVRLATITYREEGKDKPIITRSGFLIEDTDDAAERNGLVELDLPDIAMAQLNPEDAGRYAVFQYMIGNLDWSMHSGPDGEDCCHNTKLVAADKAATTNFAPVPYDFDYSGLVDAPYAVPPEEVSVRTVRQRRFRGFCQHSDEALAAAATLRKDKAAFLDVFSQIPGLDERQQEKAQNYLGSFFEDIANDESVRKELLRDCRE